MTPPTTDTSREAVEKLAEALEDISARTNMGFRKSHEADCLRALLAERDALLEKVQGMERIFDNDSAEVKALRDQLVAARDVALEEAMAECETQRVKCNNHGQYEAAAFCKTLLIHIDALKSATPAPREVTVQEAARERLAAALWKAQATDTGTPQSVVNARTPEAFADESDETRRKWIKMANAALRAIAQEGHSDG